MSNIFNFKHPCELCGNNPFLCDKMNYCEEYKRYIKAQHYKT